MHRFPSLGLKSRIDARKRLFPGKNLQRFPNSPPEIRNHCSIWADSEENLASIPKSGPEIKNHCSRGLVAVCRRNHSSLPQRRLESDAENRCRNGRCRRNHSSLRQRRFEEKYHSSPPYFFSNSAYLSTIEQQRQRNSGK